ncbi:Putative SWIRM domain-containing protein [[Torrubiella] hemipterigena]|uniref:Putative SWIRM domain-containing protein n=1 Tax=[Torrubiella] hemipterigena TaxID=1531966 RepID=A0A0A1TGX6_9HYPO|nr:Putative SWIRM domain-containing protein [[Torrubiella] hemipterigena]
MSTNPVVAERPGAAAAPSTGATDAAKKFNINSLMSPPEPILDSFSQANRNAHGANGLMGSINGRPVASTEPLPMSPPVSPYTKPAVPAVTPVTPATQTVKDPVLYPADESSPPSPPQPPLFARAEIEQHQRIVDDHVRARRVSSIFENTQPPRREDYELALTFRSQVMKQYSANRMGWLRKERALLEADRKAGAHRYHAIMPASSKPTSGKPIRTHRPTERVSKPQSQPRAPRTSFSAPRPVKRTSATPEPSRRIVAPNREDKDYNSIPDYCPPVSSLPARSNSLKVDWKGQPIDLSDDPQAGLLHPDEVLLAGNLRLDCATYLTSKRRMFERRLQCLRTGKEFRKTDAQQACKIDVNKASKLWTAFEKVGWLDAEWVRRFL